MKFSLITKAVFALTILLGVPSLAFAAQCSDIFVQGQTDNVNPNLAAAGDTLDLSGKTNNSKQWPTSENALASGDYVFQGDTLSNYDLELAAGAEVRIFVDGSLTLGEGVRINQDGTPNQLVIIVSGSFSTTSNSNAANKRIRVNGFAYAAGSISIANNNEFSGSLAAGGAISVGNNPIEVPTEWLNEQRLEGLCELPGAGGLPVFDTFESYSPGSIDEEDGGTGWGGPWSGQTGQTLVDTSADPLLFEADNGLSIRSLTTLEISDNDNRVASRPLDDTFSGDSLYMSMLVRFEGTPGNNDFLAFWVQSPSAFSSPQFGVKVNEGDGGGSDDFFVRLDDNADYATNLVPGQTYLLVAQFEKEDGADYFNSGRLWVDPQCTDAPPATSASVANNPSSKVTEISEIGFRSVNLGGGELMQVGQVAAGEQWTDVVQCTEEVTGPDHIRLTHPGSGLTCSPADITVAACANEDCSTLFSDPVTVDFISPTANWSQDPVTFTETTEVSLQYTTPESVTLDAEASSPLAANPTRCFSGGLETCVMTFLDSGFIIDVPDHTAAVRVGGTIAAVRKDFTSQRCVPGFSNVTRDVALWSTYSDPDAGTESVLIDTQPIGKASPGTVNALEFDADGIASYDLTYPDAGRVGLNARYEGSEDNGDVGLVLTGVTEFIARPETFLLDVPGNPEATNASGGVFREAGEAFEMTVSALNANGDLTPNFGRESAPESVRIESSLVAPSGGEAPAIAGVFGAFGQACDGTSATNGAACGEFNWPEVGIIALTPRLAGASGYLGFEDVVGTRLDNVGRFIPARFELTISEQGIVAPFCAVNPVDFAYMGQGLNWQSGFEPIITVDALNTAGVVTRNYTAGAFLKLDALDLARAPGENDTTAVDAQGDPFPVTATLAGMTFSNLGAGRVQYSFSETDTLVFDKTIDSRVAPFTPDYSIELSGLEDSDGVTASPQTPVDVSPSFGFQVRYGRLNLNNAYGPETAGLTVPFRAVYYTGSKFALNEPDSCWAYATGAGVALDDSGLSGGSTSVIAKDDTLALGEPPVGSELILSAPGENNTGNVGVTFAVPDWLQGDYDDDGTLENPSALATFGVYRGNDRIIYWREIQN
jgi:MSHA biogenesis protein MshQ